MPEMTPLRDKVLLEVLPTPQKSALIIAPEQETVIRWAKVLALGPDANERFASDDHVQVGQTVLVNLMSAQQWGDDYIVPVGALLATRASTDGPE